jgi:hypothetical protein
MFSHGQDGFHALAGARLLGERKRGFETFRAQPGTRIETEKIFFIWIPRNALKSPKSAKRIQGKPFAGGKGAYGTVLRHYHALFIILPSAQGPLYADRVKTPELATRLAGRALAQILQGSRGPQQL